MNLTNPKQSTTFSSFAVANVIPFYIPKQLFNTLFFIYFLPINQCTEYKWINRSEKYKYWSSSQKEDD